MGEPGIVRWGEARAAAGRDAAGGLSRAVPAAPANGWSTAVGSSPGEVGSDRWKDVGTMEKATPKRTFAKRKKNRPPWTF